MNFEETIVGKLTEVYQTVHLKEFTDFPKKDEKDPTKVFTDIHFNLARRNLNLLLMKPIIVSLVTWILPVNRLS